MKTIINKGYRLLLIFVILIFTTALLQAIFFYINRSGNHLNPILLLLGSLIYLLALIKLYNFIIKLPEERKKIINIVIIFIQLILLIISTFTISSVPKVDLIHIITEINSLNDTGKILNNTYFSVYPNNRFILMYLYSLQKIIPLNYQILFCLISAISINVTTIFTYKTVKEINGTDKALLSLFIMVLSPIFYLYVSYYYTDILMLPISSISIYLMIKTKDSNNIISSLIIGIIAIISFKLRPVAIFLLIAYIIYIFITQKFIFTIKKIIPILLSMFITLFIINSLEEVFFKDIDTNKKFPATHWIMMGLNKETNGYYSQDDYNLTFNASDKTKVNINEIKQRLNNMGFQGTIKLMIKKIGVIWSKGDYSYQKYLTLVRDYNKSYSYLIERQNIIINYLLQISKIVVLFISIKALVYLFKRKEVSFLAISLFGAIIFYLVWEVCPRYGLSFLPWLIILTSYGYDEYHIIWPKWLKASLLLITILLFTQGFSKYTTPKLRTNIVAKDIDSKTKYININDNTYIMQSLKLNNKFNKIKLRFTNISKGTYKFELLDNNKESIYIKDFDNNDINENGYFILKLDKTYEKGIYYIKLSTQDGNIDTYIAYKEMYDFYPPGSLKVNEDNEDGDLLFEVTYTSAKAIYSYPIYLMVVFISIGFEYIVLFNKKEGLENEE